MTGYVVAGGKGTMLNKCTTSDDRWTSSSNNEDASSSSITTELTSSLSSVSGNDDSSSSFPSPHQSPRNMIRKVLGQSITPVMNNSTVEDTMDSAAAECSISSRKPLHRSVHFCHPDTTTHVSSNINDWTEEEVRATWYSKSEYEQFYLDVDDTLDVLAAGLLDLERGGYCFRGLEYKTSDVRKLRKINMKRSKSIVFRIQSRYDRSRNRRRRQQEDSKESGDDTSFCTSSSGSSADDYKASRRDKERQEIADAYAECCLSSRMEAHRMGIWDAKAASIMWRQDSVPILPRRTTWAKAG
jgi:hypothetical protein